MSSNSSFNSSGSHDDKRQLMDQIKEARKNVWEVLKMNPANLTNALYRPLQEFLVNINSSVGFRQRVFLSVVYLKSLSHQSFEITEIKVLEIIYEFILVCANFLKTKKDDFLSKIFESKFDLRLVKDFINIIVKIKPKSEKFRVIESILCLDDPDQEPLKLVMTALSPMIPDYTVIVLSWINFFHLEEFRKENQKDLALAAVIRGLDLQKFLFTDEITKLEILRYLDTFATDQPKIQNLTPLESKFIQTISVTKLREICFKHLSGTESEMADVIRNTIVGRLVSDIQFQMYKLDGADAEHEFMVQIIESKINSQPFILAAVFDLVKKRRKFLAYAMCYKFQLDRTLLGVPPFNNLGMDRVVVEDYLGYIQSLKRNSSTHECYYEREGMKIRLVDCEGCYYKLLDWLAGLRNETIAFDVEANFVCQTSNATQQAVLLQLADRHMNCYLVDIVKLKEKIGFLAWQSFFILFLNKEIRRVGFDVSNDLKFLQASFPYLKKEFIEYQPEFIDLKKMTTMVIDNTKLKSAVFPHGIPSSISLENVVKALLGYNMPKDEQTKNWEKRPLRVEQIVYAARDSCMTFSCYSNLKRSFESHLSEEDSQTFLCESRVIVQNSANTMNLFKLISKEAKRGFEHNISIIDELSKQMKKNGSSVISSEDVLIVVDAPLVKVVPLLRRCGYQTFDHRNDLEEGAKSIAIYAVLADFIKFHIADGNLYLLSNRYKFDKEDFNLSLKKKYIKCIQEQTELGILETVMNATKTVIDTNVARLRCIKCAAKDTNFIVPIEVFRIIGRSLAKFKQYYSAKFGDSGDLDDEKDRNAIRCMDGYEITDKYLIILNEFNDFYRFVVDGSEDTVTNANDEIQNFKAQSNLFDTNAETVRYCRNCAVFY